jgi:lysyl-tRNA synthetase, class II
MASLEEIRAARLQKLELLKKAGMDPYPAKVPRDMCLKDARANFAEFSKLNKSLSLTGRIMAIRGQGAILFVVLDDGKAKLQAVFKKDTLDANLFKLFTDAADMGDFISVTGTFFVTQKGEESILVASWTMASKSLLPLPEKWHGLQDEEEKLRKRYLDMLVNPELRDMFVKKARFWDATRSFLKKEGFLEVETPTIELTTGGAEARPFKTHHNDFNLDVFLRISVGELWQKRLMAAGFQKTFEIGRAYRNEGSSPDHLQEFTNMEFYWAYADYKDGMKLVRDMYIHIAKEVFGTTKFTTRGHTFDLADEWREIKYADEILKQTKIDLNSASDGEIKKKLDALHIAYAGSYTHKTLTTSRTV